MTASELIAQLSRLPADTEILLPVYDGDIASICPDHLIRLVDADETDLQLAQVKSGVILVPEFLDQGEGVSPCICYGC